jgi:hypothetical protein
MMEKRKVKALSTKVATYRDTSRLADVMALIQVLARTPRDSIRSEQGLTEALQGKPRSKGAVGWIDVAQAHPEFFRVVTHSETGQPWASLIARHVLAKGDDGKRDVLTSDETTKLIDLAISLHDREVSRRDRWKPWVISIVAAFILAVASIISAWLRC